MKCPIKRPSPWDALPDRRSSTSCARPRAACYGGAEGYAFRYTDIPECTWDPQQGPNPYRVFNTLPSDECRETALGKVLEWQVEQAWAALEGSALAGRPLRIIGPGMQSGLVKAAYQGTGGLDDLMSDVTDWCNQNQIYFDLHSLYVSLQDAQDTARKFTDTYQGGTAPWNTANWAVCMELGPVVEENGDWDTSDNRNAHYEFRHCGDPSSYGPYDDWHEFVADWRTVQFQASTFSIAEALVELAEPGGDDTKAFAAVCYGPTIMHEGDNRFANDMGCLRADRVCSGLMPGGYGSTKYTPLKAEYETAALGYWMTNFTPHPSACTACGCD